MNKILKSILFVAILTIASLSVLPSGSAEASSDVPEVYVTDGSGTRINELVYSPGNMELDTTIASDGTTTYHLPAGTDLSKLTRCLYIDYGKTEQFKVGVKVQAGTSQKLIDAGLQMSLSYGNDVVGTTIVTGTESFFKLNSQDALLDPGKEYRISLVTTEEVSSANLNDIKSTVRFTFTASADIGSYTVTVQPNISTYGTVSRSTVDNVLIGTIIHVSGNSITLGSVTVTASPSPPTQYYTYSFENWSVTDGTEVTQDMTITATFSATYIPGPTPPGPTPEPSHEEHTYHNDDGSTTYEVIDRVTNPDGSKTVTTSETTVGTDKQGTKFEGIVIVKETKYSSGRDYSAIKSETKKYLDGSSSYSYVELNQYKDGSTEGKEERSSAQPDGSYTSESTTKKTDASGVYTYETVIDNYTVLTDGIASYKSTDVNGKVTVEAKASNSDGTVTTDLVGGQIVTKMDSKEVTGKRMLDATEQIEALDGVKQLSIQEGSTIYSEAFAQAGESQVTLTIASEGGSLVLPAQVSSHIADNVESTTMTLVIEEGDDESLTPAQRQVTGDKAIVVKLLDQDGQEVHELGGTAKIRFAYEIPEGESSDNMKVIYISDAGETEEMKHTYEQGVVEADVPHLSVYSVVFEKEPAGEDNTLLIIIGIAVVCLIVLGAAAYYWRSRA